MDKPKRWVKNVMKKFIPVTGFVHIWTKVGLKQPSIARLMLSGIFCLLKYLRNIFFLSFFVSRTIQKHIKKQMYCMFNPRFAFIPVKRWRRCEKGL